MANWAAIGGFLQGMNQGAREAKTTYDQIRETYDKAKYEQALGEANKQYDADLKAASEGQGLAQAIQTAQASGGDVQQAVTNYNQQKYGDAGPVAQAGVMELSPDYDKAVQAAGDRRRMSKLKAMSDYYARDPEKQMQVQEKIEQEEFMGKLRTMWDGVANGNKDDIGRLIGFNNATNPDFQLVADDKGTYTVTNRFGDVLKTGYTPTQADLQGAFFSFAGASNFLRTGDAAQWLGISKSMADMANSATEVAINPDISPGPFKPPGSQGAFCCSLV